MTFDLWPISWGHVWPESRFGEPLMRSVHSRSVSGVLVSCALAFPSAWGVLISDALRSVAVALISDHWCPPFCCGCSDHWSLIIDALTQHLSRDMIRSYRSVSVAGHEVGGILLSFFFASRSVPIWMPWLLVSCTLFIAILRIMLRSAHRSVWGALISDPLSSLM